MISLLDTIELVDGATRETRDGYLVAAARTARTGIQTYTAKELDLSDRAPDAIVRVYRPAAEVFATDALASMANKPMTNGHPRENVTSKNWKDLAIGAAGGEVLRDGEFARFSLVMMDAAAIADYRAGKRELSWGYTADVELKDGVTEDGQAYDAVATNIRANHIALCDRARGGDKLTFGDHQPTGETPVPKFILVDGLQVEVTDAAELAIRKLEAKIADGAALLAAANTTIGEHVATIAARDGAILALEQKVKDAAVTPAQLQEMAAARATLEKAARPILGDAFDFSGKDDAAIRRAAVAVKLGDAAKDMKDEAVAGAFSILATTVADGGDDPLARALADGGGGGGGSEAASEAARKKMIDEMYVQPSAATH